MTSYEKNRSERSREGKLPIKRQTYFHTLHIVIYDLLSSKCNARNKICQLNLFKPLSILLLDRMLRLKSYMKHADNINFRQVQSSNPCLEYTGNIAPCRRNHLLKCTSFPAVETGNMLSEKVASFAKRNLLCQLFQF